MTLVNVSNNFVCFTGFRFDMRSNVLVFKNNNIYATYSI